MQSTPSEQGLSLNGTPISSIIMNCDGASRGNPGPASIGVSARLPDSNFILFEVSQAIGHCTNNEAEYRALVEGLKRAQPILESNSGATIEIRMDSELVVKQILGLYKVKKEHLKPMYEEALQILKSLKNWKIRHVPRAENSMADALANRALDLR